jgi:hypothetical protein
MFKVGQGSFEGKGGMGNVPAELVQWPRISIHCTEGSGNILLRGLLGRESRN